MHSYSKKMFIANVIILILIVKLTICFNFDTNYPIIYTDPITHLNRSSYFGFSVILYRNSSINNETWIQIGSPRENGEKGAHPSGIVYRCDIFGPCTAIDVNEKSSKEINFHGSFEEIVDGAWIGNAMDIDLCSGRTVVCGYRLIKYYKKNYLMEGACYWSHVNDTISTKLLPLSMNDSYATITVTKTLLYLYGQGQAGFSTHLPSTHNELLIGAPGVYNWDGTNLRYQDEPYQLPMASKYQRGRRAVIGSAEFLNLNVANAKLTEQTAAFGLFGYSVSSGYYFSKTKLLYASGAPRSKYYQGEILIYDFAASSDAPLEVKDARQGNQIGEYFGAALTSGDINSDGYDDVVVGAPFYDNNKYNLGRIFIFLGSPKGSLKTPQKNSIIEGSGIGGQFGLTLMFLGDLGQDIYSGIAVGAPYENDHSGVVYIYNGNEFGLYAKYSQRLVGSNFVPNIRGFGMSISKPVDIDDNYYNDVAIGAYLSSHVVLLRGRPTVILMHSLMSSTPHLNHNANSFQIMPCFWYSGYNKVPPIINIVRKVVVDKFFERAFLSENVPIEENLTLYVDQMYCQNLTVQIKTNISNRNDAITISVSQTILLQPEIENKIYVNHSEKLSSNYDQFCKNCPISHPYKSFKEQTISLPFVLGCGSDDVCHSILNLTSQFVDINEDNEYVLGSTDYLRLQITVQNQGEKAYQTQLFVQLPNSVYFRNIPYFCTDGNSITSLLCNVENPLYEMKEKTITLELDTKEIDTVKYGDILNFTITVLTTSQNIHENTSVLQLHILKEADIVLIGKSGQQSYSYGNETNGKPNFTHIFQIEKLGVSPIDEVNLKLSIPTSLFRNDEWIKFAQLFRPTGIHANHPINCKSDEIYLLENELGVIIDQFQTLTNSAKSSEIIDMPAKRSIPDDQQSVDSNNTNETNVHFEYPSKRVAYLNCSNKDIQCAEVLCKIGPFKNKQNAAKIELRVRLDVNTLKSFMGSKDIIELSTDGSVTIVSPTNFIQTGLAPDNVRISTVFVGDSKEGSIELWIIILAVVVGFLVLILVIVGLCKIGFFQRTKKEELTALKEAEEEEQFQCDATNKKNDEFQDNISEDIKFENYGTK